MKAALARARVAHPELPAPDAAFQALLALKGEALADGLQGDGGAGGLAVEDLFLAFRASQGHPAAVAAIRQRLSALRGALVRTGAPEQLIQDVLAELPGDLLSPRDGAEPRILGYSGKGPLAAWLRVVAVRAVVERRRSAARREDDQEFAGRLVESYDPELGLLRKKYAAELQRALADSFGALSDEHRLVLRQHHCDGLSIDRLAALHGVHRATAARRVSAAREELLAGARSVLARELRIGEETFDSIVRLVRSEISIHLSRYV